MKRGRKMKILFVGGNGNISHCVSQQLIEAGHDLTLLNRNSPLLGAKHIAANINDETTITHKLANTTWDVVVNWVGFTQADAQRDIRLFSQRCAQYIFISSASCYENPCANNPLPIRENRPLANPHWDYSRHKIAAEQCLLKAYAQQQFPVTIVRPSHTYHRVIPLTLGGWTHYNTIARIKRGLPIIVQDNGASLWTLTHAQDFALGFIGLLGQAQAIGEAFHITSDEVMDWNTIYRQTAKALGCTANLVPISCDKILKYLPEEEGSLLGDKAVSTVFDNSKIKQFVPTFKAKIPYATGIQKTLNWFEADPARQIIDLALEAKIEKILACYG